MNKIPCNICGKRWNAFLALNDVPPIQNNFQASREKADAFPRTWVSYAWCGDCQHISIVKEKNVSFDPSYNNEQTASGIANVHHENVLSHIREACPDVGAHIVEIGCGRGELLRLLMNAGYCDVKGYDPTASDDLGGVISAELWDKDSEDRVIDLLILRHTLEEIEDVDRFMRNIADSGVERIYCEITNAADLYLDRDVFSLYPECANLFSISSISRLLARYGFSVVRVSDFFGGKWLGIHGVRTTASAADFDWHALIDRYADAIDSLERPVVLWGGGGRGGNLLAFCKIDLAAVESVVDQNAAKQGLYIPPAGQRVVAPNQLGRIQPKSIVVASQKYIDEIRPHVPEGCAVISLADLIEAS